MKGDAPPPAPPRDALPVLWGPTHTLAAHPQVGEVKGIRWIREGLWAATVAVPGKRPWVRRAQLLYAAPSHEASIMSGYRPLRLSHYDSRQGHTPNGVVPHTKAT
jgi:hypothetical protein